MLKKTISVVLAVVLCLGLCVSTAFAVDAGEERVTIGANLDENQIAQIYEDFDVERGSVKELTVTNDEEREYLEGLGVDEKIGNVALSCIYIKTLNEGEGLNISANNINWCSEDMYKNALVTAGITDASVMVSAPFEVSGTAALTGIYKAYEDITGVMLDEDAKQVGTEELIVTGEIAELIGDQDATMLVAELKKILDETQNMTDDEVREEIRNIADNLNVQIDESQIEKLLSLCRSLEGLDQNALTERLNSLQKSMETAKKVGNAFTQFGEKVKGFFSKVGDFFSKLFGK